MDFEVGELVLMKKKHPCGSSNFLITRVGMDFKLKCTGCGREIMLPRRSAEAAIKKIIAPPEEK